MQLQQNGRMQLKIIHDGSKTLIRRTQTNITVIGSNGFVFRHASHHQIQLHSAEQRISRSKFTSLKIKQDTDRIGQSRTIMSLQEPEQQIC